MSVNIKFDPSSGSKDQQVTVSGSCNPGIDETLQYQVQTVDGSKTEIVTVTQKGKREVLMVSDGNGGYTEFGLSDGGTFNVVKEEYKENPNCPPLLGIDGLIAYYSAKGLTNEEMSKTNVWKDLTGNGHDMTLHNFAWSGMSGIGGYAEDYSKFIISNERITASKTYNSLRVTSISTSNVIQLYYQSSSNAQPFETSSYSIKVSGLTDGQTIRYTGVVEGVSNMTHLTIDSDGVYELPSFQFAAAGNVYGFTFSNVQDSCDITIEQLPLYPDALVSDGVDDYGVVNPYGTVGTVIAVLDEISWDASRYLYNTSGTDNGRLYCWKNGSGIITCGIPDIRNLYDNKFIAFTRDPISSGSTFYLFGAESGGAKISVALYDLLIYNRDLTEEEINKLKAYLAPDEEPSEEVENGVYVYTSDGSLVKPSDWDTANNDQAAGVAVITDECRFAISKELPMVDWIPWSNMLYGSDVGGILTTKEQDVAITDYAGQSNTDIITTQATGEDSSNNAAHYCYAQILNGVNGYLPSAGELATMYNNKSDIDNALVLIGSKSISDRCDEIQTQYAPWFWSSTEYSTINAWNLRWEYSSLYLSNYGKYNDSSSRYAFPVFPIVETGGGTEQTEPINTYFVDSDSNPVLAQDGSTDKSWIVGRRCLAKKTDNGVAICYLDENNSNLFHDGVTPAAIDGTMGQWMTDLPEYYFHVDESVEGTHKFQVLPTEQADWKKSRRVLLGVTKGVIRNSKLWSVSGEAPTVNQNIVTFHNNAVACGEGFDIIDYETHCKLAHLFYTKYANRNPQTMEQFGYGSSTTGRTSGTTASLGNNDGKSDTQVALLGVEDPYGNVYEWMGGIHRNGQTYYIYDGFEPDKVPTTLYREYTTSLTTQYGYISKVEWGEYGDMIPTELSATTTTHYCDYGYYVGSSGWHVVYRSYDSSNGSGGFACFSSGNSSSADYSFGGSRLQYRGNIEVIEDPSTFIAMPVGF